MKIAFHTLGCKVNQYETEALKEKFADLGHTVVEEDEFADVYIINTCTVTNLADRKSRQYIRKMKRVNENALVAVTGCYAQVNPDEVKAIEGVNIVAGTDEKSNLPLYIEEYITEHYGDLSTKESADSVHVTPINNVDEYRSDGIISAMDGRTRGYIKVQEGCDRFCSYCIIPYARGKVRSRNLDEIIDEAKALIDRGYKEIVLTGINTALYGTDSEMGGIEPLIKALNDLPGKFRIRLSSLEPNVINKDYVNSILGYKKLCHHLHLSVQSGSDKVLQSMKRRYDKKSYEDIVEAVRAFDPLFGITTDIIVGFPGETEEDFKESMDVVRSSRYLKTHIFKYSPRRGTPAADLECQVDGKIKAERSLRLTAVAEEVSKDFMEKNVGTVREVLVEEKDGNLYTGFSDNYIKMYVEGDDLICGEFYRVKPVELYKDGMKGVLTDG